MSMQAPTVDRARFRDRRTWLAVLRRAAFYTLPFFVLEIHVFRVELRPWLMFPVLVPLAVYRIQRVSRR